MLNTFLISLVALTTDTILVNHANIDGIYTINKVYTTDSLNIEGKTFDLSELFQQNEHIVRQKKNNDKNAPRIEYGNSLEIGEDSLPVFRTMHFTIQSNHFVEGKIEVKKIHNYKLYIDNRESKDGAFSLVPGRANIALQILTQKEEKDTFDVKITGKSLQNLIVNATGKHPYTMADMMQGEHYNKVSISPSGKYLVTVSYFLKPDGKAQYTTILSDLTTEKNLFQRNEFLHLNWLKADKDVLYFTRNGSRGKELVVYTPDNQQERIIAEDIPSGEFSVSPNEDYLIFSKFEEEEKNSNGLKRLQEPDDRQPNWRSRNSLWRYDIATGFMQRLTFGTASVWLSDISNDGKKLLLQYSRFNANRAPFDRISLVSMDVQTAKIDTLLADTAFVANAKFSPNGKQLLILASPAAFDGIGSEVKKGQIPNAFDYKLYIYDINTQVTTYLLPHFKPAVDDYEWSKNGEDVYILANDGADRSLFSLHVKTKKVIRYNLPLTYISNCTIASRMNTPRIVFYGQTPERAREMFMATLNNTKPTSKRIGSINFDELYKEVSLGTCHNWRFKATRGDSIDGFFFLPPNFDASKKYPLIVYYYGGCTPTNRCLEFHYPLQILASQGYVVYVPNPSGAIGYGQEFAARHVNTWGKESGDDIIEGTKKFCQSHSYIDTNRVGCMGASYGGFMTEYLQTQTDIFSAAISHAGISNIASYWGGGYWGYSYGECAQYGSYPWNNPDLYVKQSPLFNADKIHTPLLLLHGTADTNVPTTESQQLYTALKILGREVCYVQIDGENHIITDFQKRLAWQNVIFAWFAKYLQNDSTWWDSLKL